MKKKPTLRVSYKNLLAASFAVAALTGCTTTQVGVDFDKDVKFSNYQTFGWLEDIQEEKDNAEVRNTIVDKRFRRALSKELAMKGIQPDAGSPKFYVAFHTNLNDKKQLLCSYHGHDHHRNHSLHGSGFSHASCYVSDFTEATLIVDFIDASSRDMIWRGWTKERIEGPSISEEKVATAIQEILTGFPPN